MSSIAPVSRAGGAVGLLAAGALLLHQLSYLLAFGGGTGGALERSGHGYLEALAPIVGAVAAALVIVSVVVPALARLASRADGEVDVTERAAGYAAALLAVFLTQELVEGALSATHPGFGLIGAAGGWLVLPLAMAIGALAAAAREALFHAEERIAVAVLSRRRLPRPPRRSPSPARALRARRALTSSPLRFGLARRPPPLAFTA